MNGEMDKDQAEGPESLSPYQAHLAAQNARDEETAMRRPATALPDWKALWGRLSAKQKLRARQFLVGVAVGALGIGLYVASGSQEEIKPANPASSLNMGAGLRGDSLEVKLRGDLKKVLDGQQLLGDRVSAIEEGKVVPGSRTPGGKVREGIDGDLPPALPDSVPALPYPPETGDISADADKLPAPPTGPVAPPAPPAPPVEKTIGAIGSATGQVVAQGAVDNSASSKKKNRTIYLPPGFMKARLLTGIDALASRDATSNPEPIIARVQAPAVLPNEVKANLAGCFVVGNATGSLAKERVEVQLVSLSCVDFDEHSIVDQPVKGFFVDTDGKKGLSGKVVTRAGATLARAFIAGTISGISQSVESTFGNTSTSALGTVRTLDAGDAAKTGIAGGFSKSSDKLTDFYLDLARQAGPIVEVGAAKDVVVVIQEGATLEIKPGAGAKF
ncbi:TraB/VirB10 family protein [Sphingobium yanoikuyae]|jgi:conjugal transfer pilus assembly protein TraB|uniref:TraB/VirB10 family protein n=1 Tax=Sphingobium yanoikuyae TaxID=13690 RepID=A0AA43B9Z4_SPHYA|nr:MULTISPECIES: TraB/VirB10 family protein [Sphingobium]MBV2150413.1 TraB/VirB10 family protein [Sphingobium sp. AS12]MDH2130665.1 TraB/VirB10 family protein [Sphingobium yanoikuyae]MDH2151012.1 TraB/VirB10 family protein [Sphingobium yanoikuyae]MDH2166138.1 TraB/VirB10 family protein [Sphingobium yanoikuyae]QWT14332.1 TraB/VirB10 family protein [Sphingobium xenophagum]|tara:strand:+ start:2208 stop:3542 length:1335 start_codon:yes stop_codon:yes gene_type:complete